MLGRRLLIRLRVICTNETQHRKKEEKESSSLHFKEKTIVLWGERLYWVQRKKKQLKNLYQTKSRWFRYGGKKWWGKLSQSESHFNLQGKDCLKDTSYYTSIPSAAPPHKTRRKNCEWLGQFCIYRACAPRRSHWWICKKKVEWQRQKRSIYRGFHQLSYQAEGNLALGHSQHCL